MKREEEEEEERKDGWLDGMNVTPQHSLIFGFSIRLLLYKFSHPFVKLSLSSTSCF